MTGAKLSLKAQSPTSCSSNNSSADESSTGGALNTYKRLVSKRSLVRGGQPPSRPLSPNNVPVAATAAEESGNEMLSQQLKKLGKYLEKKQTLGKEKDVFDSEMDEHLANIRKALAKSPK